MKIEFKNGSEITSIESDNKVRGKIRYINLSKAEQKVLDMLGNCCQDETEQCIGCGVCLRDV